MALAKNCTWWQGQLLSNMWMFRLIVVASPSYWAPSIIILNHHRRHHQLSIMNDHAFLSSPALYISKTKGILSRVLPRWWLAGMFLSEPSLLSITETSNSTAWIWFLFLFPPSILFPSTSPGIILLLVHLALISTPQNIISGNPTKFCLASANGKSF